MDRDGTLIEEREYLHRPEEVVIFPGAAAALKKLRDAGFALFIVTNQSGVGRGYFTMEEVARVNDHICKLLASEGVRFEAIYIAPEAPDQPSRGRKPSSQFLMDAQGEHGVNLSASYMVGDKWVDLECGRNAGVKQSLLVRTGYGAELERKDPARLKDSVVVNDLVAAVEWILRDAVTTGGRVA